MKITENSEKKKRKKNLSLYHQRDNIRHAQVKLK